VPHSPLEKIPGSLRSFLDASLDAIVGMDHAGNVMEFNRAAEGIFGYQRAEVAGKPLADLIIPPFLRERHRDAFARYLETGSHSILGRRLELTAMRSDGAHFPVELTITRLELGEPPRFMAFIRDLTERKQWEEALARSQTKYQDLYDHAPDMYVSLDAVTAKIVECNETTARVLGYTKGELVGRDVFDVYHPDCIEDAKRSFETFVRTGEVRDAELQLLRRDGTTIDVTLNASSIRDETGSVVRSRSVWRDVSDRRRAEQERRRFDEKLQRTQKLESLGVLAGGVAHDFNNLLTGVLGNASLALAELSPFSPARERIEAITAAAKRAAELCDHMLAYSGKGTFVIEPVSLNEVVEETTQLLKTTISRKAVVERDLDENLPRIPGDITQLRQVIINLITNASEAIGDEDGVIRITTSLRRCDRRYLDSISIHEELAEGDYACIEVSDTGCGIDQATRERLFEPFFTTKFAGRGLGLASVLGILRAHRGAVALQSEPGQGTRFRVLLPAMTGLAMAPTEEVAAPGAPAGGRILVVDDEEAVLKVAKLMLEAGGFTVLTASNGRDAIEAFRRAAEDIVCVILDLTMPELDGQETLERLRRVRRDVRVILSSGFTEEAIAPRFAGDGPAGFLKKPYDSAQLMDKVAEVLKSRTRAGVSA
jgi:PAS domain S-box-containing protein